MKRCYLQKKIYATIRNFRKALVAIIWYSWITLWHYRLREKYFSLNFYVTGSMKTRPSKTKILSPSPTLSYTITRKSERVNLRHKSHWGSWSSCGSSLIELFIGITVIVFSLGFSLIGFSLGSSVIGSSLSPPLIVLFRVRNNRFFSWVINALFPPCRYFFYQIVLLFFLSKTDVLFYIHYILKNN